MTVREVNTCCKGFDILGEGDTKFYNISREAERRMQEQGYVSEEIVSWAIQQKIKLDPSVEREYRGTHFVKESRSSTIGRSGELRKINVNTETDRFVVNQALRSELCALDVSVMQAIATEGDRARDARVQPDWIPMIEWTWSFWAESGYPQTNYITKMSLHKLTICAALIHHIGKMREYKNTVSFARLLAHGDTLLLRAQQEARSGPQPTIEYRRLLERSDDVSLTHGHYDNYSGNTYRVMWIVSLRLRTRGPRAHPFGPTRCGY
jgi:hypothetical protein